MRSVWTSFLLAIERFWDNKFQPERNETVYVLKLELERAYALNVKLIEALTAKPEVKIEEQEEPLPKPLGQQSWRQKAAELTRKSVERRKQLEEEYRAANPTSVQSVESLEEELGVSR